VSDARGCYQLRCAEAAVDVDLESMEPRSRRRTPRLQKTTPSLRSEAAAAACEVARRPFLPGLERAWVDDVRARQRHAVADALHVMGKAAVRRDPAAAVARARELLELDPVSEAGYRLLSEAMSRRATAPRP
jgi:two-component SAPR family response regulator